MWTLGKEGAREGEPGVEITDWRDPCMSPERRVATMR
jgi:hypothetical protein